MRLHTYLPGLPDGGCRYQEGQMLCGRQEKSQRHLLDGVQDKGSGIPAVEAWDLFSREVRILIIDKSRGYGNAWQEQGWRGNLARVLSKGSRLKNMLWRTDAEDSDSESVHDTLLDLAALAAFLDANRRNSNEWGHDAASGK